MGDYGQFFKAFPGVFQSLKAPFGWPNCRILKGKDYFPGGTL
jgi:hypothetical protein